MHRRAASEEMVPTLLRVVSHAGNKANGYLAID